MSGNSKPSPQSFDPKPLQLRALVLDYLCHNGYTNTARALARDSAVRQLDADGDDAMQTTKGLESVSNEIQSAVLKHVQLREEIRACIRSGRIDDATSLLNKYFPSVLSMVEHPLPERSPESCGLSYIAPTSVDPAHLALNLRILAFTEACRTRPLPFPSTDAAPSPAKPWHAPDDPKSPEEKTALISFARKLHAQAKALPNPAHQEIFSKELTNVGSLLIYKVPEESSMAKYLSQERRDAVADQIITAILYRTGHPVISYLELRARQTAVVWYLLNKCEVRLRPGAPVPPHSSISSAKMNGEKTVHEIAPPFDLQTFIDGRS